MSQNPNLISIDIDACFAISKTIQLQTFVFLPVWTFTVKRQTEKFTDGRQRNKKQKKKEKQHREITELEFFWFLFFVHLLIEMVFFLVENVSTKWECIKTAARFYWLTIFVLFCRIPVIYILFVGDEMHLFFYSYIFVHLEMR